MSNSKLIKAQDTLWSLLSPDEKIKHKMVYQLAQSNLKSDIQETILEGIKINKDAPAALYFDCG